MNMRLFSPEMIRRLGVFSMLFLIKYIIAKYEQLTAHGHIQNINFLSSEWDRPHCCSYVLIYVSWMGLNLRLCIGWI